MADEKGGMKQEELLNKDRRQMGNAGITWGDWKKYNWQQRRIYKSLEEGCARKCLANFGINKVEPRALKCIDVCTWKMYETMNIVQAMMSQDMVGGTPVGTATTPFSS
mmetsp:Transcript_9624/g.13232  ORF Transcript_9624/g.13232 Transcript_9624/m.13232 type:complete len:108 (+) Transcript_9624:149-472(+)|eukprot:CAMPEP_0185263598 /NCGR_PEP_ID=MMETSP1359-20130426/15325_1 /TAXON_ID=552665 /ORGANISM="Bigelowiella longifila, Strain CCMP242" /LENGTH=107 /DNA_ID=CAMNT_0027851227 /DNA_START=121 /DNA_END=444 /DNA_ORIENTATION=-